MSSTGAGYDLAVSIYSPDGRIFQVEYAAKAVEASGAAIGLKCKDGVVMGVEKLINSVLLLEGSNKRIFTVDKHAGVAFAGYAADGRPLSNMAVDECENYQDTYGAPIPPHVLSDRLGQVMHAYTCYGGYRPFGVSMLMAAYDPFDKQAYLHMVEPSGVNFRYYGCAIGKSRQSIKTEIERLNLNSLSVREGLKEISRIIHIIHDDVKDKPFEFEASWICEESNWEHVEVPKDLRQEAVEWGRQKREELDMADD